MMEGQPVGLHERRHCDHLEQHLLLHHLVQEHHEEACYPKSREKWIRKEGGIWWRRGEGVINSWRKLDLIYTVSTIDEHTKTYDRSRVIHVTQITM